MRFVFAFSFLIFSGIIFSSNSFTPGELFLDIDGNPINAHGGGMLFHDGKYYWFGEHKGESSSAALVGITCYSSPDLYNWEYESVCLPVSLKQGDDLEKGCIMERPKVLYNKKTQIFVMWFHLELKGQGYNKARVALATSKTPEGPYEYVKSYRPNAGYYPLNFTKKQKELSLKTFDFFKSWTPEWLEAVKEGLFVRRDFEGGQMSRDMTLFVDDDEKAYHIYSSEDNLTLHIAELSQDYQSHTGKYIRVEPAGHNEAPVILKKDGYYWMIASGCTGWDPNAARLLRSKKIMGKWELLPNPCKGEGADLTFKSQGTYIQKVEGLKDAYIFMSDRWNPNNPIDGRYVWLPVFFDKNGTPYLEWMKNWNFSIFNRNLKI